jgi:hypothetical protein
MINSFTEFLVKEESTVYFTLGKMNPPTRSDQLLLDTLAESAGKSPYKVYMSKAQDSKKNPLQYDEKVKFARKMFPKYARAMIKDGKIRTVMDIANSLYESGYKNIVMVSESTRAPEFEILLNKYNGVESNHGFYKFESIKLVSCGSQDQLNEEFSFVTEDNFLGFCQGLPKSFSNRDSKQLFNAVRRGMGLLERNEFKNHVQLEPVSDLREAYVKDGLFSEGDQVVMHKHDIVGNIKHLGSNYIIVESKGETWRCWLNDVSKVNEETTINYAEAPYKDPGDDGVVRESLNEAQIKPEWGTPESTKKAKDMTPGEKNEGNGLWHNIHKKRKEGRPMRKPGSKGAPTDQDFKNASEEIDYMSKAKDTIAKDKAQASNMIAKEREKDKVKHDRILDRARRARMIQRNKGTKQ